MFCDNNNNNENICDYNEANKKVVKKNIKLVPLKKKLRALRELENGLSVSDIANNLKVTKRTVDNWKKNEKKLKTWLDEHKDVSQEKKKMGNMKNDLVDKATLIWFKEQRAAGAPVPGSFIQLQAKAFSMILGENDRFKASNGWLQKWQQRHNIRSVTVCGEKLSADKNAAEVYKSNFKNIIEAEGLTLCQIFNCDETGLNYKMMPKRTLSAKSDGAASGMKVNKERITVMACCNASGTFKLPLVVIGKFAKPRAIKNLSSLPVYYKSQKSAWMNAGIFTEWFETEFVPKVTDFLRANKFPDKAFLFMDNCSAHPANLQKNNICVKCFPPNTTSVIQPMDQGCLQNLKMLYRQYFISHILSYVNSGQTLITSLKNITIKEVIFWIDLAWTRITSATIRNSWNALLPPQNNSHISDISESNQNSVTPELNEFLIAIEQTEEFQNITSNQVNEWFHSPNTLSPEDCLTDGEIVDIITTCGENNAEEDSIEENVPEESPHTDENKISFIEAQCALDQVITFCQNEACQESLVHLHEVKENFKNMQHQK